MRLAALIALAVFPLCELSCRPSDASNPAAPGSAPPSTNASAITGPIGATGTSIIKGSVVFHGPVPAFREPSAPFPECGQRTPQSPMRVSPEGRVANAFVYIKEGLPPGTYPLPTAPVLLDQQACDYHPRVFGIRAGQPLLIKNSDPVLHNVHAHGTGAGLSSGPDAFNVAMPVQGATVTRAFPDPQVPVAIGCDVHPWMRSFAGVVTNPYFAVTPEDGTFSLENLPAGTYTIEAWHERLGRTTTTVTVTPNTTSETVIELKP